MHSPIVKTVSNLPNDKNKSQLCSETGIESSTFPHSEIEND